MKNILILAVSLFLFGCGSDKLKDCEVCSDSTECLSGVCVQFYEQNYEHTPDLMTGWWTCTPIGYACSSYQEQYCFVEQEGSGGVLHDTLGQRECEY
ncbi:MAG: hypothetical protein NT009_08970 [Proteobacteria bacterium]|nr:hypothetical protein [Pseudomonadota bacterium]